MQKEKRPLIEELTWQDVRDSVFGSCRELAEIIDEISPGKEFTVFKVLYPFGTKISDKSNLSLPRTDSDDEINKIAKNKLSYNLLPLGIIIKNSAEVFFDINRKVFSLGVFSKGLQIGIWEYFGWTTPYNITSGARSLYMLPKISESLSHKQLRKKFTITDPPPKHLYDHWQVFCQIANSDVFTTKWYCEVIFLSEKWIETIKNDPAWSKLAIYISQKGWGHSGYSRKKAALDIAWEIFVRYLSDKNLKFDPYIGDTLKHIIYICTSTLPASAPSTGSDEFGPLKNLQTVYENPGGYGLQEYIATIMQPQYFSIKRSTPVYYSLQLPTMLESLPRTKKITSVIDNVRELSELLNHFLDNNTGVWEKIMVGNKSLKTIIDALQIDYFHGDMFAYGDVIKSSLKMPEYDPRLKYNPTNDKKRVFASNSSFLRGCVRISAKNYSANGQLIS